MGEFSISVPGTVAITQPIPTTRVEPIRYARSGPGAARHHEPGISVDTGTWHKFYYSSFILYLISIFHHFILSPAAKCEHNGPVMWTRWRRLDRTFLALFLRVSALSDPSGWAPRRPGTLCKNLAWLVTGRSLFSGTCTAQPGAVDTSKNFACRRRGFRPERSPTPCGLPANGRVPPRRSSSRPLERARRGRLPVNYWPGVVSHERFF